MTAETVDAEGLARRLLALPAGRRHIVSLSGPPGSGKSTTAERLIDALEAAAPGRAALLPMDGYHYDDGLLDRLGRRARKGAPDTFDVGGLRHMLLRLKAREDEAVAVPVFDRDIEIARAGARFIPASADLVVVEGNYLLLDRQPWAGLRPLFDLTVAIRTDPETLRRRLTDRWTGYGLSGAALAAKLDGNDLPNARLVLSESVEPDLVLPT